MTVYEQNEKTGNLRRIVVEESLRMLSSKDFKRAAEEIIADLAELQNLRLKIAIQNEVQNSEKNGLKTRIDNALRRYGITIAQAKQMSDDEIVEKIDGIGYKGLLFIRNHP